MVEKSEGVSRTTNLADPLPPTQRATGVPAKACPQAGGVPRGSIRGTTRRTGVRAMCPVWPCRLHTWCFAWYKGSLNEVFHGVAD
jgi:hypothetical protein